MPPLTVTLTPPRLARVKNALRRGAGPGDPPVTDADVEALFLSYLHRLVISDEEGEAGRTVREAAEAEVW